jgi:hypothetical protein
MDVEMNRFIRDALFGNERIRDKGSPEFSPAPVVSRSVQIIKGDPSPISLKSETSGQIFGGGGGAVADRPLTVIIGSAANKVQVVPGYVNGTMVTLGGIALDNSTPPELTISGATTIYLKVVTTYSTNTHVATVETNDTGPIISPTGFTSFRRIAEIAFSGGVATVTNITDGGNYDAASFGSVNIWWRA